MKHRAASLRQLSFSVFLLWHCKNHKLVHSKQHQ